MTQCVSSQHPNWLSSCTARDGSILVPLSGAFPAPAAAEQSQFHICSHRACAAPCEWGTGASAWCERQQQPISRLHSLWSLCRGGAQAECNHVASQDRELIWLKITYACWLSFQLLQVPDLVHQSLVPTQDRRRRYMEMSGHRNTCERCTKQYHWLRSHAQHRGICAQQGGRLKGRTGSVVLAHSFIAVDRPALAEVWGGTEMLKAKQLRKDAVWY